MSTAERIAQASGGARRQAGGGRPLDQFNDQPIWLGWKIVLRKRKDGTEEPTKVPINPRTGKAASSTDPSTWATRAEAEAAVRKYGLDGVGVVLTTLPNGLRLCGLDTDQCYGTDDDRSAPWADDVRALLDGNLTERSPSGRGRHHLFMVDPATLPDGANERSDYSRGKKKPERHGFELYLGEGRYFTTTGSDVQGELQTLSPSTIVRLVNLLEAFAPREEDKPAGKPKSHARHQRLNDHDKAVEILDHLPNDGSYADYLAWFRIVGAACAATDGSDAGLRAVEAWTKRGGYEAAECGELWKYFRRKAPRRLDIRHLIKQARAHGYEPYPWGSTRQHRNGRAPPPPDFDAEPDGEHPQANGHARGAFSRPEQDFYRHSMDEPVVPAPVLVADLVPDETAVLFTGSGGTGKGILLQTLCACVASVDKPFLGRATEHGRAVFWTAEDRRRDLLARQDRICRALGIERGEIADRLVLKSWRELDCLLWVDGQPTPLMHELLAWAETLGPIRLLGIDNSSICYGDSEIERLGVARFIRWLDLQAERLRCTIVLIGHTSRTSDGSVERLSSGSTSWVFQMRAALLLKNDEGDRKLVLAKANHMPWPFEVGLVWLPEGVLVAKDAPGMVESIQQRKDDELVLAEITAHWENGEPLPKSQLPAYMARQGRMKQKRAMAAMDRLLDASRIMTDRKGRGATGLRPTSHEKK